MSLKRASLKGAQSIYLLNGLIVFVYATLFSSLTIYLTKSLKLDSINAENITSLFLALNFILHMFSGYLSGRYLSNRKILVLSTLIEVLGIFVIASLGRDALYLGLSMIVVGCGLNSTSLQCILTSKFDGDDAGREKAFFWMYSSLNAGFLLGFSFSGYFELKHDFADLYFLGAFVSVIALFVMTIAWRHLGDNKIDKKFKSESDKGAVVGGALIIFLIPLCSISFINPSFFNDALILVGILGLLSILHFANKEPIQSGKSGLIAFFILTFFSIVFWALFYIGPLGGILFLENNVQLMVGSYHIAPQWLMNLNAIFIILGSPILAKILSLLRAKGLPITTPQQFFLSLILIAISYFAFSLGIKFCDGAGKSPLFWVIVHYLFQAAGELMIAPVGYAMVGQLIPKKHQGFMMGIWMMVSGIAVELSNILSHHMKGGIGQGAINQQYMDFFNNLGLSTIGLAFCLLLFLPFLNRLVRSVKDLSYQNDGQIKEKFAT